MKNICNFIFFIISTLTSFANAGIVDFTFAGADGIYNSDGSFDTTLAHTFSDGYFSYNLSGIYHESFGTYYSPTTAVNSFGQNHEWIGFNTPSLLNSLRIRDFGGATSITVRLLDENSLNIASQTITPTGDFKTLIFNQAGTSRIVFDFTGGTQAYAWSGDYRTVAWYLVSDVTYNSPITTSPVPEPDFYQTLIIGIIFVIFVISRRKFNLLKVIN